MSYDEFLRNIGLTDTKTETDDEALRFFKECIHALRTACQVGETETELLSQVERNEDEGIRDLVRWLREEGLEMMYQATNVQRKNSEAVVEGIRRYRNLLCAGVTDAVHYKDLYSFCMAYMDVVFGMTSLLTDATSEK